MIELLAFYTSTVLGSIGIEFANDFRIFKDAADDGYKINIDKYIECSKELNPTSNDNKMNILIPFINMATSLQKVNEYNNLRPTILNQLHVMDILEKMTDEELNEYSKNPTSFTAFCINYESFINKKEYKSTNKNSKQERITVKRPKEKKDEKNNLIFIKEQLQNETYKIKVKRKNIRK